MRDVKCAIVRERMAAARSTSGRPLLVCCGAAHCGSGHVLASVTPSRKIDLVYL